MRRLALSLVTALATLATLHAQATVYLRSSGPHAVTLSGWGCGTGTGSTCVNGTNVSPIVLNTYTGPVGGETHGLATTCGISTLCYVVTSDGVSDLFSGTTGGAQGTCSTGGAAYPAGLYTVQYRDGSHLALYDTTGVSSSGPFVGNPIVANGNWCSGYTGQEPTTQYIGLVNPFSTLALPIGQLDGPTGNYMRTLATNTTNGLVSIVVTGCSGGNNCVVTVNLSYNPLTLGPIPVAAGQYFSINDTGNSQLNVCGTGGLSAQFAGYQIASVTSSSYTSIPFTCSTLTNGTYTGTNLHCGGNGTGGFGTTDCAVVSLLAHEQNPQWTSFQGTYAANSLGTVKAMMIGDGGLAPPLAASLAGYSYAMQAAGMFFFVDPANAGLRDNLIYFATNFPHTVGGNFWCFPVAKFAIALPSNKQCNSYFNNADSTTSYGFSWVANAVLTGGGLGGSFLTAGQTTTWLNQIYNNVNDPANAKSATHANMGDASHVEQLINCSPCTTQGGSSSTTVVLNSSESTTASFYVNSTIWMFWGGGTSSWCQVSAYDFTTKIATCSNTMPNVPPASTPYQIYSDISMSDPTQAAQLSFNFARGGSPTTIVLAVGDTAAVGNAIFVYPTGTTVGDYGIVTGFSSGTATVASWTGAAPTNTTPYSIMPTNTVTGYHTHFTTSVSVGDSLQSNPKVSGGNGILQDWNYNIQHCQVLAIASDTSLTCLNIGRLDQDVAANQPSPVFYMPRWQPGDVGWFWQISPSIQMECNSLNNVDCSYNSGAFNGLNTPSTGGNFTAQEGASVQDMNLIFSALDPRAAAAFEAQWEYVVDYELGHFRAYGAGWLHTGPTYTSQVSAAITRKVFMLQNSIPSYQSLNPAGWMLDSPLFKIFSAYPDKSWTPFGGINAAAPSVLGWGSVSAWVVLSGGASGGFGVPWYAYDPAFAFAPTSANANYLRYFLTNVSNVSMWTNQVDAFTVLTQDPRIASASYTSLPSQYLFQQNDTSGVLAWNGWNWGNAFRGDMVVSESDWTTTASHLALDFRTYIGDHDAHCEGCLALYRVGGLLGRDGDGTPWGNGASAEVDDTVIGDMIQFGGATSVYPVPAFQSPPTMTNVPPWTLSQAPITMWASATHGANSPKFGDQNSQYMAVCADIAPVYQTALNYAFRCTAESKPTSSGPHVIYDWSSTQPASSTAIRRRIHYVQNGENLNFPQPEGHTTCPGAGGCASLNTNGGVVVSTESNTADAHGSPVPAYGVVSQFLSPNTITLNWVCPAGGDCTTGSNYTGGHGHTDPVDICGGGSCGTSVSIYETLVVHKVMTSTSDTALTTTAIIPDANWYGAQASDSSGWSVSLFFRGSACRSSITSFSTANAGISGNGQYLIVGLCPGSYPVTVNGTAVTGSPFTVSGGDNTIEFVGGAGTVSFSAPTGTFLKGACASSSATLTGLPSGAAVLLYSPSLITPAGTRGESYSLIMSGGGENVYFGTTTSAGSDTISGLSPITVVAAYSVPYFDRASTASGSGIVLGTSIPGSANDTYVLYSTGSDTTCPAMNTRSPAGCSFGGGPPLFDAQSASAPYGASCTLLNPVSWTGLGISLTSTPPPNQALQNGRANGVIR